MKLVDCCKINVDSYSSKDKWPVIRYLDTGNLTEGRIDEIQTLIPGKDKIPSRAKRKVKAGDILFSTVRPNQRHYGIVGADTENLLVSTGFAVITTDDNIADFRFIYYFLTQDDIVEALHVIAEQSVSAYPSIKPSDIEGIDIPLPKLETQRKIAAILSALDDKIELNRRINANLEQQAAAIFTKMFASYIGNVKTLTMPKLGDLVTIIDNRGKTPPLAEFPTDCPIIDVRALTGKSRILDFSNCSKYVTEETYKNWFRNGHPKEEDLLLSTVGSLAEIKIFLGTKGCIAQNVVGIRAVHISPYYLYQYLNVIKKDLVAYNIGTVQPSIKVTHIIKHPIYVPSEKELYCFDEIAREITKKIYINYLEAEKLATLRDALLPRLMSGEIDVSDVSL